MNKNPNLNLNNIDMLKNLEKNKNLRVVDLSRERNVSYRHTLRVITKLVNLGLVTRVKVKGNLTHVNLTENGKSILKVFRE